MKENVSYLVIKKDSNGNDTGKIREWDVLSVSQVAYKVMDRVKAREDFAFGLMSNVNTDEAFWVLKSEVDTIGKTRYQILEELKPGI